MLVRKRDGKTTQDFDVSKIETAIRKAWTDVETIPGAADILPGRVKTIVAAVTKAISDDVVDVETIQDVVETTLMRQKLFTVAKAYILYRQRRAELRNARRKIDPAAVSDYIHFGKYARYQQELGRREVYEETVTRDEEMHLRKFKHLGAGFLKKIKAAFDLVREKRLLPSMRSMQFGGLAIEYNNNRMYNCAFSLINRVRAFGEAMFLLLSGCGVGYSVQFEHVDQLPELKYVDEKVVKHHIIADTIEGWADAVTALVESYVSGHNIEFSYHLIRDAGKTLHKSGGKAPGHRKLKLALERVRSVLHGAQGRKLRPIEVHDILCHEADAVLSGGIRRSAMICLFSLDDSEMLYSKTGNWHDTNPWRANANNSVMLKRDEVKKKQFLRIFEMTKQWGEPGFFFCSDFNHGTNPCCEIGLNPLLIHHGVAHTGWAFCNLCEINAAKLTSLEDFYEVAHAAALIGTLQASYTDMKYLGWVSEAIAKREALLGIGMTGMMDAPTISLNLEYQREVAAEIIKWNAEYAAVIGINPAARTTCVKPSGTTSLELGGVASGHHAHHAKRYIRRVTADELETVFQAFKAVNPAMCVRKPDGKYVIEFPVEAPEGAILKENLSALAFLEMVKSTQLNWVLPGTAKPDSTPGLNHNVSNTVHVKPEEWGPVAEYLWTNREFFTGVSLLSSTGDKDFQFAPFEAITTEADEARWNQLVGSYQPVDYTKIFEADDDTSLTSEPACAGGACAI